MTKPNETSSPSAQPTTPNPSRRRLFKGVAGGTGVLLSVHAKTALGTGICKSPSQIFSGNTSPRPDTGISCSGGRSPGYWSKLQHFGAWGAAGATPPSFNPALASCSPGVNARAALSAIDPAAPGTTFEFAFGNDLVPIDGVVVPRPVPLWAVIYDPHAFKGTTEFVQFARHLACAWLNARYFRGSSAQYPLTEAQVKDMWLQVTGGSGTGAGTYCPTSTTCSVPWTMAKVTEYIEGMYDLNAPVENYCPGPGGPN